MVQQSVYLKHVGTVCYNAKFKQSCQRFAQWFIHSQNGAIGVFWPKCRIVYFRFGAKMTDASSKIDVPRLKEGDLLIRILVHCAFIGLD